MEIFNIFSAWTMERGHNINLKKGQYKFSSTNKSSTMFKTTSSP